MKLAMAGAVLIGLAGLWVGMWLYFRMMDKSGVDWGLAYNMWEKSSVKQEENKQRGIAQQAAIARRCRQGLPVAGLLAVAGIVLIVVASTA